MDKLLLQLNSLGTQLTPLAKSVERGLGQARQLAQEKLGQAEDLTELPAEYIALEHKVDGIDALLKALLKAQGASSTFVPASVVEAVSAVRATAAPVLAQAPLVGSAISGAGSAAHAEAPKTNAHAVSRACAASGDVLAQEPLGAVARKLGAAEEKLGDAEVAMKITVNEKFLLPIGQIVHERIANVSRARRNVTSTRLSLDAVKARFKSAPPAKAEALQVELEKAEDVFVDAVEEATKLMKAIVESPATLRHISDLVAAQLAFHQQAAQVLTDLVPEIDELQVTQSALYKVDV